MRAITVRQPYAWAIIHGGKDVENRSRNIAGSYRGPVAIHVGLAVDYGALDYEDVMSGLIFKDCPNRNGQGHNRWHCDWCMTVAPKRWSDRGHIIGVADLVDVHHADSIQHAHRCYSTWGHQPTAKCDAASGCSLWASPAQYHLVLGNPRPLADPIPARGRLGLWTVPDDVAARIEAAS